MRAPARFFLNMGQSALTLVDMRNTIQKHKDFLFDADAPTVLGKYFIAKVRPTIFPGDARYGLIVTKKTFKRAVKRNRAKRLLRVWIRLNSDLLHPDMDYIFIARHRILDAKYSAGMNAMASALTELNSQV